MKILVTGFKPFLGEKINPSQILAENISAEISGVSCCVLPVEFQSAFEQLINKTKNNQFDFIILLGQAAGRSKISLEKIALNWLQTEHADESGVKPVTGFIFENRDLALMTEFPVDEVYESLKAEGYPVEISFSAGTYVCNNLYYKCLAENLKAPVVFIHVPLCEEQIKFQNGEARPYLPLHQMQLTLTRTVELLKTIAVGS